jgi:hypothetical protein
MEGFYRKPPHRLTQRKRLAPILSVTHPKSCFVGASFMLGTISKMSVGGG